MIYLRRAFTYLLLTCSLILSAYAGIQLWSEATPSISWLGLLLATAPICLAVMYDSTYPDKLQPAQIFAINCICGLGVALTMTSSWKYGNAAGFIHIWAGSCLVAWVLLLKWRLAR
jgi:hypothetical protein